MERFMGIFKRHPLWIVGAVIGVLLLFWLMSKGGGSSQPVIVSTGPSDSTVQANAAVEIARLQAARDGNLAQQSIEGMKIQADSYDRFLNTTREVSDIQADRDVQIAGIAGNTQTSLATIVTGAQTSQTQIVADLNRDVANIDKSRQIDLANISAALRKEEIAGQNAAAVAAANAAVTIEQIKGDNAMQMQYLKGAQMGPMGIVPGVLTALLTGSQPAGDTNVFIGGNGAGYTADGTIRQLN